jgi:glycosyltransferase involved in cell wall biosynthesis
VFELYTESDCLLFPSKLETWGLPITEFKTTGKLILAAELPYAHETVGTYQNVSFFDVNSPEALADLMMLTIKKEMIPVGNQAAEVPDPFAANWEELFNLLLAKS